MIASYRQVLLAPQQPVLALRRIVGNQVQPLDALHIGGTDRPKDERSRGARNGAADGLLAHRDGVNRLLKFDDVVEADRGNVQRALGEQAHGRLQRLELEGLLSGGLWWGGLSWGGIQLLQLLHARPFFLRSSEKKCVEQPADLCYSAG